MAYRHKLSCRLALLRDLLSSLVCALTVATCEPPVTAPTGSVTQLVVVPDTLTVDPAQVTKFVPYGRSASGDSAPIAVSWSATGGTITADGMYSPDTTAGDFTVTATSAPLRLATSSRVHNRGRRVASVSVSPSPATVMVGQMVQLTATPKDANGNSLTGRTITWGSSNAAAAMVDGTGQVTGMGAGGATITATSETKNGTASITVTAAVVAVATVSVSPSPVSVTVGQTAQLVATPKDASGNPLTGRVVTWGSSNPAAATVSGSGLVTAVAAGAATITATSETKSGTASVTVTNVAVATVGVSPATASVAAGQTVQLTATPKDASGNPLTGRVVTWGSSNPAVATVSGSGVVRGVAAGTATITATSEGQSGTAALTVTPAPVATVSVSPATATVNAGQTVQLTVTLKDANGNTLTGRVVTWGSSNTAAATVSGSGLVTGVAAGTATITATSEGQSGTAALTVRVPVASVGVSPASASVTTGQTVQLTATPLDANGNPLTGRVVTWGSSNTAVATVNGSGLVTGVVAGTATITATSEGQSGTAALTVTPAPVATVSVSPAAPTVNAGQTVQLTATLKDANGNTLTGRVVTWGSSNTAAATVSGSGLVTGVAAGTATITATSEGQSGTAALTVRVPVASVGVSPASASLSTGQTVQLTATPKDANGNTLTGRVVTWGSSNTAVATVNGSGLVTGVVAGTATITATSEGQSGTASVTVTLAPVATVSVSPAAPSVNVGQAVQLTVTLKDANGNTLTGRVVTWGSSNTAAATVNGSGLVTGVAAGSATITATSETKTGTAVITVTAVVGGTVLFQEDFADASFGARGWYDNPAMGITSAEHAPGSTSALEIHFTPGASGPTWGGAARHQFQPTATLYVSYWVKYSTNWVGSGQIDHPHEFYLLSNLDAQYSGLANDWLTTYIETNFVNGVGAPRVSLQDNLAINTSMGAVPNNLIGVTENRSVSGCNGVMETNLFSECYGGPYNDKQFNRGGTVAFTNTAGTGYKSNWNHVETYVQMNSIVNGVGQADGVVQYWFNGALIIDRHDVLFRTGARSTLTFAQFIIAPYIGNGSPVDQTMWVDNLTVATAKP